MGKLPLPFVSYAVAWMRERYHPSPLPFTAYGMWETCPWGHKSRRAIPAPHQLQHLGESPPSTASGQQIELHLDGCE